MYTIVGIERKHVEYEGKVYDNTLIHCIENPADDVPTLDGVRAKTFKVSTARVPVCIAIEAHLTPVYGQYGAIVQKDGSLKIEGVLIEK